jgi:hypothetical protein
MGGTCSTCGKMINAYNSFVKRPEERKPIGTRYIMRGGEAFIKIDHKATGWTGCLIRCSDQSTSWWSEE